MEKEKNLKSKQHYIDLYDRHTVENCRRTEQMLKEKEMKPFEEKKYIKKKTESIKSYMTEYLLHFETGERYINKEKTIKEWMDADQAKDDLYESAQAPESIRCLSCRNLLKPTYKDLWSRMDKPDRVLFMYDCPNKCLPHRAFFNDGEEWRVKPNLCPNCNNKLDEKVISSENKLTTNCLCPKCGYANTEEMNFEHKEEPFDEKFAADRDRFCLTDEDGKEYQDGKYRLEQLGKLMEEFKEEEKARDEKLKVNPKGFHLEGVGYTCSICHGNTPEGDNWYDEWGIKCLVCQKAIDEGEIPARLAKEKDSWYSKYDLESRFNLKSPTIRKWIRDGIIKARTVSHYGNGVHVQLFLIEDNKDFLPPKKLTESQSVSEVKDGKTWYRSEEWYKFVDPVKHLKGYKIMNYLKVVHEEPPKVDPVTEKGGPKS